MSLELAGRQALLAATALAAALAVVVAGRADPAEVAPAEVPAAATWREARVAPYGGALYGTRTACDVELTPATRGVAHPLLPCGVDLIVAYGDRTVRTEVIDRGPSAQARDFDLTEALARDLGVDGLATVRWRFAG